MHFQRQNGSKGTLLLFINANAINITITIRRTHMLYPGVARLDQIRPWG